MDFSSRYDLKSSRSETELKIKLLEDLGKSFQLSTADIESLCKGDVKKDNAFFDALDHANTVERNCKRLLLSDKQTLGYALDEYITARRNYTVTAFSNVLTLGASQSYWQTNYIGSTGSKPMELHAHDPVRYTSDMLAWIHQLTASEREASEQMMRDIPRDTTGLKDILQSCLDGITGALAAPFKTRMEQLLVSQQDGLLLYRINNVLRFYEHTLSGLLPDSAVLFVATHEMQELSWHLLFNSLRHFCQQTLNQPEFPPSDLSVSDTVQDTLQLLLQILNAHDISMVPEAIRKTSLEEIINVLVTPLTAHCQLSADQLLQSAVPQPDLLSTPSPGDRQASAPNESVGQLRHRARSATYLANCVYRIESALAAVAMKSVEPAHIQRLSELLNSSVEVMVVAQVACVLNQTRLDVLGRRLYPEESSEAELSLPRDVMLEEEEEGLMSPEKELDKPVALVSEVEVTDAMVRFDSYLSNPDRVCLPELQLLSAQRLRKVVRRRAFDAIHSYYQRVYEALQSTSLRLPMKLRTPGDVAALILNF